VYKRHRAPVIVRCEEPRTIYVVYATLRSKIRQKTVAGWGDGNGELPATYRLHAAHCTEIAANTADIENKLALLGMARAGLLLAEQAERRIARSLTEPVEPAQPTGEEP